MDCPTLIASVRENNTYCILYVTDLNIKVSKLRLHCNHFMLNNLQRKHKSIIYTEKH